MNHIVEIFKYMSEKRYTLAQLGLTDKLSHDWRKADLYLEKKKTKARRKYNMVEYVWLRLVMDLRRFGLSYDAIRKLKDFLLSPIDIKQMIVETWDEEEGKELKSLFDDDKKLSKLLNKKETKLMDTLLCYMIHSVLLAKEALSEVELSEESLFSDEGLYLLINAEGGAYVVDTDTLSDPIESKVYLSKPVITYPVRHIVNEFLARENIDDFSDELKISLL